MDASIPQLMLSAPLTVGASGAAVEGAGSVSMLVFYVSVSLTFSFLCSLLEAALLSSSTAYVEVLVHQGSRAGALMKQHKENVERPISAILTLNTVAHTVGAASAGAEAAAIFGNDYVGIISAVLTLLILVLSEIIPKTLGAVYWRPLTPFTAYAIQWMMVVFAPAVWAFERLGRLLTPNTPEKDHGEMRSELEMMAQLSSGEGALEATEHLILSNVLKLDDVPVSDIMTPRTVLFALPQTATVGDVMQKHPVIPYSRIPVYDRDYDNLIGFVLRFEIFAAVAKDADTLPLKNLVRPIENIPETLSVTRALEQFIKSKQHLLLVIDEFGGTAGILTMEDVIESLLGAEITDESDIAEDLRKLAEQRYTSKRKLFDLGKSSDETLT